MTHDALGDLAPNACPRNERARGPAQERRPEECTKRMSWGELGADSLARTRAATWPPRLPSEENSAPDLSSAPTPLRGGPSAAERRARRGFQVGRELFTLVQVVLLRELSARPHIAC